MTETIDPASTTQQPMEAAKQPIGVGPAPLVGLLVAVLIVAVGVVGVQHALYATDLVGTSWLDETIEGVDGLRSALWVLLLGVALIVVGLWLLLGALRPRPKKAVALRAETGVFLRPRDLERLAGAAATDVPGVLDAGASATRRKVTVKVEGTGDQEVAANVTTAVRERLAGLENPPSVSVAVSEAGR